MTQYFIFMVALALILAFWEIQIEGKNGWAGGLPCWRITNKWVMKLMGGRPLTGYHFYMIAFLIVILHFPATFTEWNFQKELLVWGFLFGLLLLEDFFWFVLNPDYGLSKFRKGQIPWHQNWWGLVPDFYCCYLAVATTLIYFGWQ